MSAGPHAGAVAPEVARELPELGLWWMEVAGADGRSPDGVRQRLRLLADRIDGARAIALRSEPITHAYRVLARHVGIDPDHDRVAAEAVALQRLRDGGFRSRGRVADGRRIAVMETRVPVWALAAERVHPPLALRVDADHRLVVADADRALAPLLADPADEDLPGRDGRRVVLYALQPAGVPQIHVDEALALCAETLDSP